MEVWLNLYFNIKHLLWKSWNVQLNSHTPKKSKIWSIFWYRWVNMLAVLKKSFSEKSIFPIHVSKARSD